MALEYYPQAGFELLDDRIPIWRFMKMRPFTRFVESGSIYFCRADRLGDEHEGLPLEQFVRDAAAAMGPGHSFESMWRSLEEDRQGSFVSCWTLHESLEMWQKFAPQGVAVESRCGLLKAALRPIPARSMVGYVRYSFEHEGFNILRFITTKRPKFRREREVRAMLWDMQYSPRNPYPHDKPEGLSFPVDVKALALTVIVSPYAPAGTLEDVQKLLGTHGYTMPVVGSGLTGFDDLLLTVEDIDWFFGEQHASSPSDVRRQR